LCVRHVLIVTQNFPPTNEIAARRFGFLVPHLEGHGWTPWVLTTPGSGPLPVRIPEERVFRIGRNSNRLPATLTDAAGRSRRSVLGIRSGVKALARWAVDRTGSRVYSLYPANFDWYHQAVRARDPIQHWLPPIDIVVGSFQPSGALLIAAHFARLLGVPWLADVRDVASLIPGRRNPLARRADRWIERRLFRSAAGFLTVSPTLAQTLEATHRRPAAVIYNGWDLDSEVTADSPGPFADHQMHAPAPSYLHYAGLLYAHRMPAAQAVLEALRARPGVSWKVRSLGPAVLEKALVNQAQRLGVADRLEILAPADPAVIRRESEGALANIVLEDLDCRDPSGRGTLTGKFLKLLPAPAAVLAVARQDSDIGPILVRTAKGRLCSSADTVAAFLEDVERRSGGFLGNADAVAEYSMPAQAAALARLLDERRAA
jgi:hypothetical protein